MFIDSGLAISEDLERLLYKNVRYYNPEACEAGSGDDGGNFETSGDNEQDVWDFFKSKGLDDQLVAGIMGNIYKSLVLIRKHIK